MLMNVVCALYKLFWKQSTRQMLQLLYGFIIIMAALIGSKYKFISGTFLVSITPVSGGGGGLSIIGQNQSICKSNRLHVVIFRLFFTNLRNILWISLKWWAIFLKSRTSTGYFSNSTGSSVTSGRFSHSLYHTSQTLWIMI